jgi:hypothetical protein
MKVSELITKLQELDQDKMIVIDGYEGGCDFPTAFTKAHIVLNQNTEWWYGKHSYIHSGATGATTRKPTCGIEYADGEWNAYLFENYD